MHGGIWAMWASCRRAPTTRFLDEGTTPHHDVDEVPRDPMLSELGHAQAARRLADAETVELLVWHVHLVYSIYTSLHEMIYHIIYLSIYLSIHPSIHPPIHPSIHPSIYPHIPTYILLILLQGGLCDEWFYFCILLFLFGDIYGPFFYGGIQLLHIIVYHSVIWDHEVDKNSSQSVINH